MTAELIARLAGTPLLGVIGTSGSGKASVLRPGLLPALAEQVGLTVEPELTDRLQADFERQPGGLPLLSTALVDLWVRRDGRRLQLSADEETGGVNGAVARLAENAFRRLDVTEQPVARDVLTRLVVEGAEDGVERLLTVSDGTLELAHEALLREWPRLSDWIAEDRDDLRIHRNVGAAARERERLDRDSGALYRGTASAARTRSSTASSRSPRTRLRT